MFTEGATITLWQIEVPIYRKYKMYLYSTQVSMFGQSYLVHCHLSLFFRIPHHNPVGSLSSECGLTPSTLKVDHWVDSGQHHC